jgi:hypothetical protein
VQRFLPASSTDLLESLLQSEEDEEINEPSGGMGSSGCSGRRCSANEHCCPGTVCVDLDGRKSFHCCVRVTAIHQVALRSMAQKKKTRPKFITCINESMAQVDLLPAIFLFNDSFMAMTFDLLLHIRFFVQVR